MRRERNVERGTGWEEKQQGLWILLCHHRGRGEHLPRLKAGRKKKNHETLEKMLLPRARHEQY